MNEKKLAELIDQYTEFFKEEKWNYSFEERLERKKYYQTFNYEKIMNLSYDEMKDYLKKLWNVLDVSCNKVLDKNGFDTFKENLARLLYGENDIKVRYDEFHNNIQEFKISGMSEVLSYNYPNEFMIWNDKIKKVFEYLEIKDIPKEVDSVDYDWYKKLIEYDKIIKQKIENKIGNDFDLLDVDYFLELTASCYLIDYEKLNDFIYNYKNEFDTFKEQESIKWRAIKIFQDNWNIDASNFIEMFNESFKGAISLLNYHKAYLPLTMINQFAEYDVERVRGMFKNLFDENLDLKDRYIFFIEEANKILKEMNNDSKSNQDLHSISVYLSFRYPDKYYIYKNDIVKKVSKALGSSLYDRTNNLGKEKLDIDIYSKYNYFCNSILKFILKDNDLLKLNRDYLQKDFYNDSKKHVLLWDILYFAGLKEKENIGDKVNYWLFSINTNNFSEYVDNGYIKIGWDKLGNLIKYKNDSSLKNALNKYYPKKRKNINNYRKKEIAVINKFVHEIKENDIIIVKNNANYLYGYGVLKSRYIYENGKNICKVNWNKVGEFDASSMIFDNYLDMVNITDYDEGNLAKNMIKLMEEGMVIRNKNYNWLISGNEDKVYDLKTCFLNHGCVEWIQDNSFNENDIVYIYSSGKTKKIKYKTIVLKMNIRYVDREIKKNYYLDETKEDPNVLYMRLKLLSEVDSDYLNLDKLRENGLISKIQAHEKLDLKPELLSYIEKVFKLYDTKYLWSDMDKEVFLKEEQYNDICRLLNNKQNIIIQGPPGVGKTYMIKKLIYTLIEREDDTRIEYVQFHQNYSYEDFVRGYRPTITGGFELKDGIFLDFCKKIRGKNEMYYFIIDEINRGNLSKIFGELLTLIEKDKREQYGAVLAYQKSDNEKEFTIPKNLCIIGLMNTADRSIDSMDYAFRRRFAFYNIKPLFDTPKFINYETNQSKKNPNFKKLIQAIKDLNREVIAKDDLLGEGFAIGHSYFSNLDDVSDSTLLDIIDYEIEPLLKEYWYYDRPDIYKREIEKLRGVLNDKNK